MRNSAALLGMLIAFSLLQTSGVSQDVNLQVLRKVLASSSGLEKVRTTLDLPSAYRFELEGAPTGSAYGKVFIGRDYWFVREDRTMDNLEDGRILSNESYTEYWFNTKVAWTYSQQSSSMGVVSNPEKYIFDSRRLKYALPHMWFVGSLSGHTINSLLWDEVGGLQFNFSLTTDGSEIVVTRSRTDDSSVGFLELRFDKNSLLPISVKTITNLPGYSGLKLISYEWYDAPFVLPKEIVLKTFGGDELKLRCFPLTVAEQQAIRVETSDAFIRRAPGGTKVLRSSEDGSVTELRMIGTEEDYQMRVLASQKALERALGEAQPKNK